MKLAVGESEKRCSPLCISYKSVYILRLESEAARVRQKMMEGKERRAEK